MTALPPLDAPDQGSPETLYGRAAERATLRRLFDATRAGQGRLALISGEAGIGKTALVGDLARYTNAHDAIVLTGHSYDMIELSPYTPWIEILQQYDGIAGLPAIPTQLRVGVDLSDARSQQGILEQGRDLFGALADLHPLVIVLEDAHWADQASLEALHYLARWLASRRVLFVVTYRDEEQASGRPFFRLLPELVRALRPQRLELRRIGSDALDQLANERYRLPDADRARLVAFLAERSEGNPFFALEILRSLETEGLLEQRQTGWRLGDTGSFRMPPLLRQIMSNRLAGQDEQARGWLEVAAVIGMEVPFALWSQLCDAPDEQLASAFERARDLALVREVPGRASFEFGHALLRAALYERLPLPRRLLWHARIAEALAAGPQPLADQIAHHFGMAGDPRAIDWLIRAGEQAQSRYAWPSAVERYEQAVTALEDIPARANDLGWLCYRIGALKRYEPPGDSLLAIARAGRVAAETGDRVLQVYSRFMSSLIESFTASSDRPLDALRDAVEAIGRLSADDLATCGPLATSLFADLTPGPPDLSINLGLGTLALRLASTGRHEEAEDAARRFLEMFDGEPPPGDPALKPYAAALTALGFVHTVRCEVDLARAALHRARAAYHHADDRRAEALGWFAELILLVNAFELHRRDERRRLAERAADAMQRAQGAFPSELPPELFAFENLWIEGEWDQALAYAGMAQANMGPQITLAEIALQRGRLDDAWAVIEEVLPERHHTAPGRPSFLVQFNLTQTAARLCLAAGDLDEAAAWIECSARWIEWGAMTYGRAGLALLRAKHAALSGDAGSAQRLAEDARQLASDPPQARVLMPAHRLLAQLAIAAARYEEAEQHTSLALRLADEIGAPFEAALTRLVQAELALATGAGEDASHLLAAAGSEFERLGAAPWLERAQALGERLAAPEAASEAVPGGLSAREIEVLRLVAEGLTDAEVAERLFISRRTVSQHLRSIYNKLGVGSRVAATRFAMDHGLL